jgi:prepilin-type processing-associated H-X9-DG protein
MYVNDYQKYPGNCAMYEAGSFQGIWGTGLNWLNPYVARRLRSDNSDNVPAQHYWGDEQRTVFSCTAEPPTYQPGLFGAPGLTVYNLGYGYNELGTGWKVGGLGLGFTVTITGSASGGWGQPVGPRHHIGPGDVKKPGNMIAMGDGSTWLAPNHPSGGFDAYHASAVFLRHRGSANVVFCDGHVEQAKGARRVEKTESAMRCWNSDNQPHPETW